MFILLALLLAQQICTPMTIMGPRGTQYCQQCCIGGQCTTTCIN